MDKGKEHPIYLSRKLLNARRAWHTKRDGRWDSEGNGTRLSLGTGGKNATPRKREKTLSAMARWRWGLVFQTAIIEEGNE